MASHVAGQKGRQCEAEACMGICVALAAITNGTLLPAFQQSILKSLCLLFIQAMKVDLAKQKHALASSLRMLQAQLKVSLHLSAWKSFNLKAAMLQS